MAKIFGSDEKLIIQSKPDSDGDLLISMPIHSGDISCAETWIDREEAKRIMEHLQNCFGL